MMVGSIGIAGAPRLRSALGALAMLTAAALLSACAAQPEIGAAPNAAAVAAEARPTVLEPDWREHFNDLSKGAVLINLDRKFLAYWEPGGRAFHAFPIAVPLNEELRRTGMTRIVRMREDPDWRPTPNMRKRMPELPPYIGPGPGNPLGSRAMYLSWQYYAIHGTNDPSSIGSQATSGCIRMTEDDVQWLYQQVQIGTPVRILNDFETRPVNRRSRPGAPASPLERTVYLDAPLRAEGVATASAVPTAQASVYAASADGVSGADITTELTGRLAGR